MRESLTNCSSTQSPDVVQEASGEDCNMYKSSLNESSMAVQGKEESFTSMRDLEEFLDDSAI